MSQFDPNAAAPAKSASDAAGDPRVYLAAERTFLAWIRTGIALMGFGFVLARFGIFLRQMQAMRDAMTARPPGASVWLGVALVTVGVAVNIAATLRHVHIVRSIREGRSDLHRPSRLGITMAVVLACIGLITVIYLIFVSDRAVR